MNKKIALAVGSILVVGTTLFAQGMNCEERNSNCNNKQEKKCDKMQNMKCDTKKNCDTKGMMNNKRSGNNPMLGMIHSLDLSDDQKAKIEEIIKTNMKNMPKTSDAFSDDSFNKELFIKLSNERKDNKIQKQADTIESVYNLLTAPQKKELKAMMNAKKEMMQKRNLEKAMK